MLKKSTFNKLFIILSVLILIASIYLVFIPNAKVFAEDPVVINFKIEEFWKAGLLNIRHTAPNVVPKHIMFSQVENFTSLDLTSSDVITKDDEDDPLVMIVVKSLGNDYDDTIYIYFIGDVLELGDNESAQGLFVDYVYTSTPYDYLEYIESIDGLQYLDMSKSQNLSAAFFEKKYLKTLDLSQSLIGANAQDVSYMFYNCIALQRLILPSEPYFVDATKHVGMFYGLDSLGELDLSYFRPTFTFEMDKDFNAQDSTTGLYNNFIKADNLYKIKLPISIGVDGVPQTIRNQSLGEFAIADVDNNQQFVMGQINDTISGMWGIEKWQYRVGYVDYYITIDNTEYKLGSDTYLQSYSYYSKRFTMTEIGEIVGKTLDNMSITTWQANEQSFNYAGAPGYKMGYSSEDEGVKYVASPVGFDSSNHLKLYANTKEEEPAPYIPMDNNPPYNPEEDSVIEELPKEDEGLTTGQKAGIAVGVVGGTAAVVGTAGYFFTGVAEIDGVKKLVIVTKKTADEAKVLTFKGKKYKIKRKNLKIRGKEKEDENGKKKRKKIKIPIFFLKK